MKVGFLQVDVVVTIAGGIEEDIIKCLAPTYKGNFSLPGAQLRSKGLNRIGNLLVPNDNYCKFEDWIIPIFDEMLKEQSMEVFFSLSFYADFVRTLQLLHFKVMLLSQLLSFSFFFPLYPSFCQWLLCIVFSCRMYYGRLLNLLPVWEKK